MCRRVNLTNISGGPTVPLGKEPSPFRREERAVITGIGEPKTVAGNGDILRADQLPRCRVVKRGLEETGVGRGSRVSAHPHDS